MILRLVDTNIVSFDMKGHSLGARYKPHLDGYTLAIAFMTLAEIYEVRLAGRLGITPAETHGNGPAPLYRSLCRRRFVPSLG